MNDTQNIFKLRLKDGPKGSGLQLGTYEGLPVIWIANKFLGLTKDGEYKDLDQYVIGAYLYDAIKEKAGWTHGEAAAALGIKQRTAEGIAGGRVSKATRHKLVMIAKALA